MELCGKQVVVMGLGRFGGGVGVTRFLLRQGAKVLVTDQAPAEKLSDSVKQLQGIGGLPIEFRLGGHDARDFACADLIVVNPAVDPRRNPYLHAAAVAGVPTTSEIRLLLKRLPGRGRTIGVTGTAGKSTVAAMIGHILNKQVQAGKLSGVWVGGNLGGSLLDHLDHIRGDDWVVLELSSFMLEGLRQDKWSPHVAVVTNLFPNHLDRHGTLEAYIRAKQAILDHQTSADLALLGPTISHWRASSHKVLSAAQSPPVPLSVPGTHHQLNARMAIEVCNQILGQTVETRVLADFTGLPHRLQWVTQDAGVRYFNDSKATTPQAAMLAIRSFDAGIVHAILGGYDKGSDLAPLAHCAAQHCRAIYTIGATGATIADAATGGDAAVFRCATLDRAVTASASGARAGDVVLLSPGCASWDQFDSFEQRGDAFVAAVPQPHPSPDR